MLLAGSQGVVMEGLGLKESRRRVLTIGKASVIRDVLSLVLAAVKSEGAGPSGARQRLEALAREHWDRLILDLRTVQEPAGGGLAGVSNLRVCCIGGVPVVTGEVSTPEIFRQIRALSHPPLRPRFLHAGFIAGFAAVTSFISARF